MSTWEERMAAHSAERQEAAEAEQRQREAAEHARLVAEFPALAGESDYVIDYEPHYGHRTHVHPWHGLGTVTCSCGAPMGVFSFVVPDEPMPEPEPCPVCTARGVLPPH